MTFPPYPYLLATICLAATFTTGCRRSSERFVSQTYVHKYGLPVERSDWQTRGSDGEVISKRKDGTTVTAHYKQGVLDGETAYTFPHIDTVARVEIFDHGSLISEKIYYPTGVSKKQIKYLEDGHTEITHWYDNGTPCSKEVLSDASLVSGEYFSPQNQLEARIADGEGIRISRGSQGQIEHEERVNRGEPTVQSIFYPSGDPKEVVHLQKERRHGERKLYLTGGIPDRFEHWENGELHGITMSFDHGQKHRETPYYRGLKQGIEKRYDPKEQLCEEISWVRNLRHGANRFYIDGQITTDWYHHGQPVSEQVFANLNPGFHQPPPAQTGGNL